MLKILFHSFVYHIKQLYLCLPSVQSPLAVYRQSVLKYYMLQLPQIRQSPYMIQVLKSVYNCQQDCNRHLLLYTSIHNPLFFFTVLKLLHPFMHVDSQYCLRDFHIFLDFQKHLSKFSRVPFCQRYIKKSINLSLGLLNIIWLILEVLYLSFQSLQINAIRMSVLVKDVLLL